MTPNLLSNRLKELEQVGVIAVTPAAQLGAVEYKLTEAGEDLRGVIMSLGIWGQRWVESSLSLKNLDPAFLMWDMRRNLKPMALPDRRCTVEFIYPEVGTEFFREGKAVGRKLSGSPLLGGKAAALGHPRQSEVPLAISCTVANDLPA